MALEKWAFDEVARGRTVDEVIQDVVTDHDACAVLSIAVALAMESKRVSEVTLPLAISQQLWHWDIARYVNESQSSANLIGFRESSDVSHLEAVRAANTRPARHVEIRWLAQLFVLNPNEKLRNTAQAAIQAFPNALPFEYEEEKTSQERVAWLKRIAEIWSEAGRIENYRATPARDGTGTLIGLENPTASDPDVVATAHRSAQMNEKFGLLVWISDSFEGRNVSSKLALNEAIARAKKLDRSDLYDVPHGTDDTTDLDQSVVVGVAAIVACYTENPDESDLHWSAGILFRAYQTKEYRGELWSAGSALPHHPCLYSASGFSGLVRRGIETREAQAGLLTLAGHPLEKVSEAALDASLSLWEVDANFAWIALNLAIRLSVGSRDKPIPPYGYDHSTDPNRMAAAVDAALTELASGKTLSTLQSVPAPWVFAPPIPRDDPFFDMERTKDPVWREPDEFLRWDFLPKIFGSIPVDAAMNDPLRRPAFISFCYELLNWTLEHLNPSWQTEAAERRDRESATLLEWRRLLFWLLAQVALHLEPDETQRRILDPVFALDDETAASLIRPFVDRITTAGIFDAREISPRSIALLKSCLRRVLQDRVWRLARHNEGQLYGFDAPEFVRLFLFVSIEFAGGAARFANDDWREVEAIMPIVDPFVREIGDIPGVMSAFLTLCERAIEHYPAAVFVEQGTAVLNQHERTPVGWRNTTIPGRIAGLVYAFAERLQPLPPQLAQAMLRVLDRLVDMGDRRSSALQTSEMFKNVRV
jgi:hypothetical protein